MGREESSLSLSRAMGQKQRRQRKPEATRIIVLPHQLNVGIYIRLKEDMTMQMKVIGYWATTTVIALELLAGGVTDLVHGGTNVVVGEPVVEILAYLGYPVYLLTILGLWKLPAAQYRLDKKRRSRYDIL